MTISIDIPADLETTLRSQFGGDLEQRAKQDLAASWFSAGRITSRQVAALLGMSLFEAHAFLKSKGATIPMTIYDVEDDLTTMHEMRGS